MVGQQASKKEEQLKDFSRSEKRHLKEKFELLNALEKKYGVGVRETVRENRARTTYLEWQEVAKVTPNNSISDLIEALWKPMLERGIVQYEILEPNEGRTSLRVTDCLFANLVRELGIPGEWGFDLYCMDDQHMVRGFNPKMEFTRTKTLMEGHDCCDHCYKLKS